MYDHEYLTNSVLKTPWIISIFISITLLFQPLAKLWTYWRAPRCTPLTQIPGPGTKHWFFGFLTSTEAQTFQMSPKLLEHCNQFDGVWASTFTNRRPTLVLGDADGINYVLNNAQTYTRAQAQMRLTRLVFGDGLVGVDGEQHRKQRKVIGPAFSNLAVDGMMPVFNEMTNKLAERWDRMFREQQTDQSEMKRSMLEINAYSEFEKLSLDIIGTVGFRYNFKSLEGKRSELEAAFVDVTKSAATGSLYSSLRSQFPFVGVLGHWFSQEQIQLDRLKESIRAISKRLVQDSKRQIKKEDQNNVKGEKEYILSRLVQSNLSSDVKDQLGEEEIISMIPTLLSGGYDNNASAMSYAVYGLARFPQTQKRLQEELLRPLEGCGDWQEDPKSLNKLSYLDAVCRETLRLYSPAHSIPRTCIRDDIIPLSKPIRLQDGSWTNQIYIGADNDVVIPQKWMNVDPELWGEDAHLFKPERWLQDPNHQYYTGGLPTSILESKHSGWSHLMTFSIGPRNCIGYRMAVAEFKICLALLISKFEFIEHDSMDQVYGEVQIVDRPRVHGMEGYRMPCWVRPLQCGVGAQ